MTLGELCEKYHQTLDELNEATKAMNELRHELADLRNKIATESGELVFQMCTEQIESLTDDAKKKLKLWIAEALYTLLYELENWP